MILYIILAVFLWIGFKLYRFLWAQPRSVLAYFAKQGVKGKFKFLVGQLAEIRKAAEDDTMNDLSISWAKELGESMHLLFIGPLPQLCVHDPDLLREINGRKAHCYHKSEESMKDILRPLLGNGLLLSEDEFWKRQRALLSPGFHFIALKEMLPMIVEAASECVNNWIKDIDAGNCAPGGVLEVEISNAMATIGMNSVVRAAFGSAVTPALSEKFVKNLKTVLDNMQARSLNLLGYLPIVKKLPFASLKAIQNGCGVLNQIVKDIIEARRQGKSHAIGGRADLLDLLLTARTEAGEPLSVAEIQDESMNFIAAGAETTSNLMTWMLMRLVNEPTVWQKCVAEVDAVLGGQAPDADTIKDLRFIEAAAYEALRLHPPAPVVPKYAIKDHDLGNVHIPAGTQLTINSALIHLNPKYWDNPLQFRPERFLSAHAQASVRADHTTDLADEKDSQKGEKADKGEQKRQHPYAFLGFSAGPRKCIGKNFAMIEIKVTMALIVQRLLLELVPGQTLKASALTKLPQYGMKMRVRKRPDFDPNRQPLASDASRDDVRKPVGMI